MGDSSKEDEEVPLLTSTTPTKPARIVGKKEAKCGKKGSCILAVGSTGTGKTSTINIFTGSREEVGNDFLSKTQVTKTVEDKKHIGSVPWVNNPG